MNVETDDKQNTKVAEPVTGQGKSLDQRVFVALRTRCHPRALETAVSLFSVTGNWGVFWLALALVFWISGSDQGRPMILSVPLVVFSTLLINYAMKESLGRERPVSDDPALKPLVGVPSSKSFPSSHAAMSFAAATIMTYIHPELWPLLYGLAFLMSWTRVYVGVHYPSDVLAGTAVGLFLGGIWTLFFIWF